MNIYEKLSQRLFSLLFFSLLFCWQCNESNTIVKKRGSLISPNPIEIFFPDTLINESDTRTIIIQNLGDETLNIIGVSLSGDGFSLKNNTTAFLIEAGNKQSLEIVFTPKETREYVASLLITSNDKNSPLTTVPLKGKGISQDVQTTKDGGDKNESDDDSLKDDNDIITTNDSDTVADDSDDNSFENMCDNADCLTEIPCTDDEQMNKISLNTTYYSGIIWANDHFQVLYIDKSSKEYHLVKMATNGNISNNLAFGDKHANTQETLTHASMAFAGKWTGLVYQYVGKNDYDLHFVVVENSTNGFIKVHESNIRHSDNADHTLTEPKIVWTGKYFGILYQDYDSHNLYYTVTDHQGLEISPITLLDSSSEKPSIDYPQLVTDTNDFYVFYVSDDANIALRAIDGKTFNNNRSSFTTGLNKPEYVFAVHDGLGIALLWNEINSAYSYEKGVEPRKAIFDYLSADAKSSQLKQRREIVADSLEHNKMSLAYNGFTHAMAWSAGRPNEIGPPDFVLHTAILSIGDGDVLVNLQRYVNANEEIRSNPPIITPMGKNGFSVFWKGFGTSSDLMSMHLCLN